YLQSIILAHGFHQVRFTPFVRHGQTFISAEYPVIPGSGERKIIHAVLTIKPPDESDTIVILSIKLRESSLDRKIFSGFNVWRKVRHPPSLGCINYVFATLH